MTFGNHKKRTVDNVMVTGCSKLFAWASPGTGQVKAGQPLTWGEPMHSLEKINDEKL